MRGRHTILSKVMCCRSDAQGNTSPAYRARQEKLLSDISEMESLKQIFLKHVPHQQQQQERQQDPLDNPSEHELTRLQQEYHAATQELQEFKAQLKVLFEDKQHALEDLAGKLEGKEDTLTAEEQQAMLHRFNELEKGIQKLHTIDARKMAQLAQHQQDALQRLRLCYGRRCQVMNSLLKLQSQQHMFPLPDPNSLQQDTATLVQQLQQLPDFVTQGLQQQQQQQQQPQSCLAHAAVKPQLPLQPQSNTAQASSQQQQQQQATALTAALTKQHTTLRKQLWNHILMQRRWLLFVAHAAHCKTLDGKCAAGEACVIVQHLAVHMKACSRDNCKYARCGLWAYFAVRAVTLDTRHVCLASSDLLHTHLALAGSRFTYCN